MKTSELKRMCEEYANDLMAAVADEKNNETVLGYLAFCSRFHRYSRYNRLIIWVHKPDATFVAGFKAWQKMGRFVKKGEKGIPVFAPMRIRKKADKDPDDGDRDEDKEKNLYFKVVYVWDVSQTDGEALPETPDWLNIQGDPGELLQSIESLIADFGIRLETVDTLGNAAGVSGMGHIQVISSLEENERISVLCHELAHELLHGLQERMGLSKKVKELEAESTAYIVCRHFGLLDAGASVYLSCYRVEEIDIMASLDRIVSTASRIISGIEKPDNREFEKAA